jgi:hypothetical protein
LVKRNETQQVSQSSKQNHDWMIYNL